MEYEYIDQCDSCLHESDEHWAGVGCSFEVSSDDGLCSCPLGPDGTDTTTAATEG